MRVVMFQPQFAPKVADGRKRQTIRPKGKRRPPRVGELLSLREWTGKPYRSKTRVLLDAKCTGVTAIGFHGLDAGQNGTVGVFVADTRVLQQPARDRARLDAFAMADGFTDWTDMLDWFKAMHGLPFEGWLIQWEPQEATR